MNEKIRLDKLLTDKGYAESREKAKAMIMAGNVLVNNDRADKPGDCFREDSVIEIIGNTNPYVSRGGLKLEKAMELYGIDLSGKVCMDIGASTGGFTDCMIKNGAAKVYAVDVGYGQLAWSLRNDERVVNMERTNIRYVTPEQAEPLDFASADVSFISLTLVLPVLRKLMKSGATALCLVKPQFEAGREKVGKKGVVRETKTHIEVLKKIYDFLPQAGFTLLNATFSPIKGPQGNIEYLYYIKAAEEEQIPFETITDIVEKSHQELD